MKKLNKLVLKKKSIVELRKEDAKSLKGGYGSTYAHDSHVNTCFTYNCCKGQIMKKMCQTKLQK